jgi:hypothetical protein
MKASRARKPKGVRTTSIRASDFLLDYLRPGGEYSIARRRQLERMLRDDLGSKEELATILRGAHGTLLRQELAKRVSQSQRKTTSVSATETLLDYLRPGGKLSLSNRAELQRILAKEMKSGVHLGCILRGAFGVQLRLELAERARSSRVLNSYGG